MRVIDLLQWLEEKRAENNHYRVYNTTSLEAYSDDGDNEYDRDSLEFDYPQPIGRVIAWLREHDGTRYVRGADQLAVHARPKHQKKQSHSGKHINIPMEIAELWKFYRNHGKEPYEIAEEYNPFTDPKYADIRSSPRSWEDPNYVPTPLERDYSREAWNYVGERIREQNDAILDQQNAEEQAWKEAEQDERDQAESEYEAMMGFTKD